jgi:beta-mannosidase
VVVADSAGACDEVCVRALAPANAANNGSTVLAAERHVARTQLVEYRLLPSMEGAHYVARRFFSPVMVSLVEKPEQRAVEVWVTSDRRAEASATLRLVITDCEGEVLHREEREVRVGARSSALAATLEIEKLVTRKLEWAHVSRIPQLTPGGVNVESGSGPRDLLIWAEIEMAGEVISRNHVAFAKPKHLELVDPKIEWSVAAAKGGSFVVTMLAKHPALYMWLELDGIDARFSDNFFDLRAGESRQVTINPTHKSDLNALKAALKVRSVYDTYALNGN